MTSNVDPASLLALEHLDRSGLATGDAANAEVLAHASIEDMMDAAAAVTEACLGNDRPRENSIYAHWSTLSLSGGEEPCRLLQCRVHRAEQLARYALLYSDRVYVHNPFSAYLAHPPNPQNETQLSWVREHFADTVSVFLTLRPLIERGVVVPLTPPMNYCQNCLVKLNFGNDADGRLTREQRRLEKRFFDAIDVEFRMEGGRYGFLMRGPEDIVDHGALIYHTNEVPDSIRQRPELVRRVQAGERVHLSKTMRRELSLHGGLAEDVWRNIRYELAMAQAIGTTFLTERSLHLEILNSLSEDQSIERRNHVAQRHLTSVVPFVGDVGLRELIRLREREAGAFVQYRDALNRAIGGYASEGGSLSERSARALYSDVIAPSLVTLDRRVMEAKKDLVRNVTATVGGWVGAISFGVYAGFVPADLVKAASLLGLTAVAAKAGASVLEADSEAKVRNEEFYFLWKVRALSERASRSH